jgi:lipoate-protein ligase A
MTLYTLRAPGVNPYENLSIESGLIEAARDNVVVLYLWQNHRTVVIGRNQNAYAECRIEALERDGGFVARRPSGGGAVFHDLGNLNFSFIAGDPFYDEDRQHTVVMEAMALLGIATERSGRNDLTIDGRKFSGNAFSHMGHRHCHHGTLMVDVDTSALSHYLTASPLKLKSKGVQSVRSRVCNLTDCRSGITIPQVEAAMVQAFGKVYGATPQPLPEGWVDAARIEELRARYSAPDWIYGRRIPFTVEMRERLSFGEVTLQLKVEGGQVSDALCYSDALDTVATLGVAESLLGQPYRSAALEAALLALARREPARASQLREWAAFIKQSLEQGGDTDGQAL